jgi:hypothetical protein
MHFSQEYFKICLESLKHRFFNLAMKLLLENAVFKSKKEHKVNKTVWYSRTVNCTYVSLCCEKYKLQSTVGTKEIAGLP